VLSAVIVGLLTSFGVCLGGGVSPRVSGIRLTGSRGRAYVVTSVAFGIVFGATAGFGMFASHGGRDVTPIAIAVAACFFEAIVFLSALVIILRGLMLNDSPLRAVK
jgi:hypothetical protein